LGFVNIVLRLICGICYELVVVMNMMNKLFVVVWLWLITFFLCLLRILFCMFEVIQGIGALGINKLRYCFESLYDAWICFSNAQILISHILMLHVWDFYWVWVFVSFYDAWIHFSNTQISIDVACLGSFMKFIFWIFLWCINLFCSVFKFVSQQNCVEGVQEHMDNSGSKSDEVMLLIFVKGWFFPYTDLHQ
jgi:hypothetical protein